MVKQERTKQEGNKQKVIVSSLIITTNPNRAPAPLRENFLVRAQGRGYLNSLYFPSPQNFPAELPGTCRAKRVMPAIVRVIPVRYNWYNSFMHAGLRSKKWLTSPFFYYSSG